ncbi:hypothetical protein BJF83_11700 [Nocardiopsis sp. CNR-923]|uniref:hypothetical protein n=1 Tax=Nocardiopsis sp. CNR-923 TaxID=1904965 RepID=UPI0009654673|nr:hypothetical protein [Nocardiopsis sp. CNR-923]OLT29396.1 hypothetical protein BJF83_11700 [Nocardiopsis sp. CNR-923]
MESRHRFSCLHGLEQAGPPADLRRHVTAVVPTRAIAELLGVPAEGHTEFVALAEAAVDPARAAEGLRALLGYIHRLVAACRPGAGENVISGLRAAGGTSGEGIVRLAMVLFFAGEETTKMAMTTGVARLMAHRDQWERLRKEPARIPDAVEEIVRTMGRNGGGLVRYARTDFESRHLVRNRGRHARAAASGDAAARTSVATSAPSASAPSAVRPG